MLRAILNKLKEVLKTNSESTSIIKDSISDQALAVNFQPIWGSFTNSLETDAARAAFLDCVRLLVGAFHQKERHLARAV